MTSLVCQILCPLRAHLTLTILSSILGALRIVLYFWKLWKRYQFNKKALCVIPVGWFGWETWIEGVFLILSPPTCRGCRSLYWRILSGMWLRETAMSKLLQVLYHCWGCWPRAAGSLVNHINGTFSYKSNNQAQYSQGKLRQKGNKFVPHDKVRGLFSLFFVFLFFSGQPKRFNGWCLR